MISAAASSSAAGCCRANGSAWRPSPSTHGSIAAVDGDQPSADWHTSRLAAKLSRVASRQANWTTQGEKPSRDSPSAASRGWYPGPPARQIRYGRA